MLNIRKTSQQGQLTFGLDKLDLLTKRQIRSTNVKLNVDSPLEVRQIRKLIPLLRKSRKIDLRLKDMGESDSSRTLIKHLGRLNYVKDLSIQAPQIIPFETYTPLLRSNYRYKLKKLSMDFFDYDEIPDKVFVTLGRFLKNARMIEDLAMNFEPSFYSFASSTNMSVYLLSKGIRKLRMLKKFHIGLRKTVELNDKCLIILNKSLRNKTKLTDLSIDLSKNKQVANEGFLGLGSLLNASPQLKRVNLIFNGCDLISNEALINLKSNYDLTKSNFEIFGISLLGCERIGDEGAETIVQMIKSNSNLKSLKIDLNKSSITNQTLISFSEEFKSLKNIENIELNFPICYSINDDALKALQQSLTTIITLKNFKIDFRGCSRISDRGIEKLCEGLGSLSQLTNLGLNFSWGDHISNASLEHLNHAFQKLTSLQTLSLDFHFLTPVPKSYMVTDTGIGHLGQGIGKLTSLKKLRLNFEMCMITDQSMIHIKNALLSLSELKEFTLNVNGCTFVTHKGFVLLQEPFVKLKNLEYIKLDIERCHHIVSRAIAQVKSATTHIPTLIINR